MNQPDAIYRTLLLLAFTFLLLVIGLELTPRPAQGSSSEPVPGEDLTLQGDRRVELNENIIVGNLTLREEALLVVDGSRLTVNGTVIIKDRARLMMVGGVLEVWPGDLDWYVTPIIIRDQAMLRLTEGARAYCHNQTEHTMVPYLSLRDTAEIIVHDSTFRVDLPTIYNQSLDLVPAIAGTIVLEGQSRWYNREAHIVGRLNTDDHGCLFGRWFWLTLHQGATFELHDSTTDFTQGLKTFLKPVAGNLIIDDTQIPNGVVDIEVTSKASISSTYIGSGLNLRDRARLDIIDTVIEGSVSVGIPAPDSPPGGESIAQFSGERIQIAGTLKGEGASQLVVGNSTINELALKENASLAALTLNIHSLRLENNSWAHLEDCKLNTTTLSQNGSLVHLDPRSHLHRVHMRGLEPYFHLRGGILTKLNFYSNQTAHIKLERSRINVTYTWGAANLTMELIDSYFGVLQGRKSPFQLHLIDVNSQYDDYSSVPQDLDMEVFHRLEFDARLDAGYDSFPVPAEVAVTVNEGVPIVGKCQSGLYHLDLPRDPLVVVEVDVVYLGFSQHYSPTLNRSHGYVLVWEDTKAPRLSRPEITPKSWNLLDPLTVTVTVEDLEVKVFQEVVLIYSIDDGPQRELNMFPLGGGTYVAQLPPQDRNTKLEVWVRATDMSGQSDTTDTVSFTVGATESRLLQATVILVLTVVVAISALYYHRYRSTGKILKEGLA